MQRPPTTRSDESTHTPPHHIIRHNTKTTHYITTKRAASPIRTHTHIYRHINTSGRTHTSGGRSRYVCRLTGWLSLSLSLSLCLSFLSSQRSCGHTHRYTHPSTPIHTHRYTQMGRSGDFADSHVPSHRPIHTHTHTDVLTCTYHPCVCVSVCVAVVPLAGLFSLPVSGWLAGWPLYLCPPHFWCRCPVFIPIVHTPMSASLLFFSHPSSPWKHRQTDRQPSHICVADTRHQDCWPVAPSFPCHHVHVCTFP